ncbi:hypothetical protein EV126DRAFT_120070 [Verticillium dahliae]|nr:hypothetical protein EV126DRAFT_120070 [Verticillium dahliae]
MESFCQHTPSARFRTLLRPNRVGSNRASVFQVITLQPAQRCIAPCPTPPRNRPTVRAYRCSLPVKSPSNRHGFCYSAYSRQQLRGRGCMLKAQGPRPKARRPSPYLVVPCLVPIVGLPPHDQDLVRHLSSSPSTCVSLELTSFCFHPPRSSGHDRCPSQLWCWSCANLL